MAELICRASRLFTNIKYVFPTAQLLNKVPNQIRCLSTSVVDQKKRSGHVKNNILQMLWDNSEEYAPPQDAHSKTLTDNKAITYEIVFDVVKPKAKDEYVKVASEMQQYLDKNEDFPGSLVGSWNTVYGDVDQSVHIWMYRDGYKDMKLKDKFVYENQDYMDFRDKKMQWLNSQRRQICHHFGYWGIPKPREPEHIYEMRSYSLKAGTLIEWANRWGQAINIRRKDAVGGFFSQIGDLYQVHHIWAYNDLAHRAQQREQMWSDPGWDDCVAATVPLIKHMTASILKPKPHSPMQ